MDNAVRTKLDSFFSQYTLLKFKKGEILVQAEDTPNGIFYLVKGSVKQYTISKEGEEQIFTVYKPQSFFPMMWAIGGIHNIYYFEAASDIELWKAPKDDVIAYIKEQPDILYDLLNRLFRGMSGISARIEFLMFGSAYDKVLFTIFNFASRFGQKDHDDPSITSITTTHKEIAAFSGLTKETISRESHKLQKKGLIELSHTTITIPDMKRLEGELTRSS